MSKRNKYIIAILAIVVLLLIVIGNIVASRYKKIIHDALPAAVANGTDSLYHISVKNVSINLLNRRITLKNVRLWPDSAIMQRQLKDSNAKKNYYSISIPKLQVSGIMWDQLVGGEGYSCGSIKITKPNIIIYKTDSALTTKDTILQRNNIKEFSAGTVRATKSTIKYITKSASGKKTLHMNNCNVTLESWKYSNESITDSSRFLLAEEADITIGNLTYERPQSYYRISVNKVHYNSLDSKLTGKDLKLQLKESQQNFLSHMHEQKEIYNVHLPTIELAGIDRTRLVYDKELYADALYLNHSKLTIFLSRLLPENTKSKMGRFPHQLLQKMRLPVYVKKAVINNGSVTYTEVSDKTQKEASIYFDKLNGEIANITNIPAILRKDSICKAKLVCKLNKYTDMTALFNLSLADKKGGFTVDLKVEGLQSHQLYEQTKAFSLLEIKSLNMKSLHMQLAGDEQAAGSEFTMLYNNLGIRIMQDEKNLVNAQKTKGFLSFIANNMILYSSNPMRGEGVRHINTYVERTETKSFFNLIWQNILYGVRETTIRDMQVIEWIKKQDKNKNKITPEDRQQKKMKRREKRAKKRGE